MALKYLARLPICQSGSARTIRPTCPLDLLDVLDVFPRCAMRFWWGNAHVLTRCGPV
jgi:hypothetical protein